MFYPFTESDKDLSEKIGEDVVDGASIVMTRKAVVGEFLIRDSTNLCKTIAGIAASQLCLYCMSQARPKAQYTV